MCGIFAYLNHLTPKTRREILDILISGLKRLEYRGYDSAGVGVDGSFADQESYNIYFEFLDTCIFLMRLHGKTHKRTE